MADEKRSSRVLSYTLPTLALAGGVGLLGVLRERFQRSRTFLPVRYPSGVWDPAPFGLEVEDVWFRAADGVELHGWWMQHRKPRGTILFCHGNTGCIANQIQELRLLLRLRVGIFAFDYRGYGRSGGRSSEKGLYRDVRAAFDHLVEARGASPREILLLGHSLGGAVAIDCATDRPAAGLIVQASFTSVRDAAKTTSPNVPLHLVARRQFRSLEKVERLELPKLIVHGAADSKIPPSHAERLFAAAAEPKELYLVPGAQHNDLHLVGGRSYLRRLSRFRDRCLA